MVSTEGIFLAPFLFLIIAGSIIGNVLVVCAIRSDRALQSPANFLICSLAVTDLLVAGIVMPFSAFYQILGRWVFGGILCEIWTATDIACCTASILHLCAIALERHQSITNAVQYFSERMRRTVAPKIAVVWLLAFCISIPPILGWKPSRHNHHYDVTNLNSTTNASFVHPQCKVGHHPGYTVYATLGSFYIPLALLLVVYSRIYVIIHRHIKRSESRSRIISTSFDEKTSLSIRSKQSPPSTWGPHPWRSHHNSHPRKPYSWRLGNVYHYNTSKRESDLSKRRSTRINCNSSLIHNASCDSPKSRSSEEDGCRGNRDSWSSLGAKAKRSAFRRQVALTVDQISELERERRRAPPCVQYSLKKWSLEGAQADNVEVWNVTRPLGGTRRKWRSESEVTHLCYDDVRQVTSHRRRTQTAGHVHFAERNQNKTAPTAEDDVFCASSVTSSSRSLNATCCWGRGGKLKSSKKPHFGEPSPMLIKSFSLRAKIKVLKAREIRAIRTLGTIVGAFIFCWLPFFAVTLAAPFCACAMPQVLLSVVLWLGYCNSLVNPILYAAFNRDFHSAFKRLFQKMRH